MSNCFLHDELTLRLQRTMQSLQIEDHCRAVQIMPAFPTGNYGRLEEHFVTEFETDNTLVTA